MSAATMRLPGFVNAHSHAFQRGMRGVVERVDPAHPHDDFWTWREEMYAAAGRIDPDSAHAVALAHGEAQAEGITLGAEQQLAGLHRLVDEGAEVVRSHEPHRGPAEDARALERAPVQQHLREAQVVACGRDPAGAAGVVLRRYRHVDQPVRLL